MADQDRLTSSFYAQNAKTYTAKTSDKDVDKLQKFMAALPPGGHILELGCGGGYHSLLMLEAGFDIHPTDGTPEIAKQAEKRLKRPVQIMDFGDLEAKNQFDGVWANACLLHVQRAKLADILKRIHLALKPVGTFYASFKAGTGEGRDQFDRYYNYPTPQWLSATYKSAGWENIEVEQCEGGGFDKLPTTWLHVTATKPD